MKEPKPHHIEKNTSKEKDTGVQGFSLLAVIFVFALLGSLLGGATAVFLLSSKENKTIEKSYVASAVSESSSPETENNISINPSVINAKYAYNNIVKSVVQIEVYTAETEAFSRGTGFIIASNGVIVTNAHVLINGGVPSNLFDKNYPNTEIKVRLEDSSTIEALVLGIDPRLDLAVIKINTNGLSPAKLGTSINLAVGDAVIAVGNALGLGSAPTATAGIISAVERSVEFTTTKLARLIQTDAAVNPGNSGGPLVNAAGEVIGINTAIAGFDYDGLGFAISIDSALPAIELLKTGIVPMMARLGAQVISSNRWDMAVKEDRSLSELNIPQGIPGAVIVEVTPGSSADLAGVELGDLVVEFDGASIMDESVLRDVIATITPGSQVHITLIRASNGENGSGDTEDYLRLTTKISLKE